METGVVDSQEYYRKIDTSSADYLNYLYICYGDCIALVCCCCEVIIASPYNFYFSKEKTIKTYDSVVDPDYLLLFDTSLLKIPKIRESIKTGVTLLVNSPKPIKTDALPKGIKIFIVDASGICIKKNFMHSSGPILNIPMLGAFGKITGYYDLDIMSKVIKKEFGENKVEKNMSVAKDAYETVREI